MSERPGINTAIALNVQWEMGRKQNKTNQEIGIIYSRILINSVQVEQNALQFPGRNELFTVEFLEGQTTLRGRRSSCRDSEGVQVGEQHKLKAVGAHRCRRDGVRSCLSQLLSLSPYPTRTKKHSLDSKNQMFKLASNKSETGYKLLWCHCFQ